MTLTRISRLLVTPTIFSQSSRLGLLFSCYQICLPSQQMCVSSKGGTFGPWFQQGLSWLPISSCLSPPQSSSFGQLPILTFSSFAIQIKYIIVYPDFSCESPDTYCHIHSPPPSTNLSLLSVLTKGMLPSQSICFIPGGTFGPWFQQKFLRLPVPHQSSLL